MIPTGLSPLANHLWQSTLCGGVAWLLALALKSNRPAIRYWVWFAASVKFLVPFSLLVGIGGQFPWRLVPAATPPEFTGVFDQISRPFGPATGTSTVVAMHMAAIDLSMILVGLWLSGIAVGLTFGYVGCGGCAP